jgi:gamma-glutamylcyclotransferase (GGCT)/AIG2-like uncharacterized protein YtfP
MLRYMKNVFVYGSLMFDEVWKRLVRRRYAKLEARLPGYKKLDIKGELYPGLVKSKNSCVDGIVYLKIKNKDLLSLDKYEGKYYQRTPVLVCIHGSETIRADVYLFKKKYKKLLAKSEWDAIKFRTKSLNRFLSTYPAL